MKKVFLKCVFCTLLPLSTFAQEELAVASVDDDPFFEMSLEDMLNTPVVSASKANEKLSDAPATMYVITKEQIQLRGYTSLAELLADIPEIEVQEKNGTETSNTIAFRGTTGNQKFMIMLDGNRINSPSGSLQPITQNYSVANAEQVEIILGPASALYGVDAFTGIVNIISRDGSKMNSSSLNASYGNYNTTNNSFIAGYGNDSISFNLNGSFYRSDEPNLANIYKKDFAWFNDEYSKNGNMMASAFSSDVKNTGTPKAWNMSSNAYTINASLRLKNLTVGLFRNSERHASASSVKPEYSIYAKDHFIESQLTSIYANHEQAITPKISLSSQFLYSNYKINPESSYNNVFSNYNKAYKYSNENNFLLTEQGNFTINNKSSIILGVQFQHLFVQPISGDLPFAYDENVPAASQNMYYVGTNLVDANGKSLAIQQDFYNVSYQNIGSFLQYKLALKEWIKFTLGARADYNTRYGSSFSPRMGVVLSPTDKLKIKLLYGSAFLSPSPYATYQHFGAFIPTSDESGNVTGFQSFFWHLPNPDLKPERINTFELGANYSLSSNFSLRVNGFYNQLTDLITTINVGEEVFKGVTVASVDRPVNQGKSATYGGTFLINRKQSIGSTNMNISLAYSHINGTINDKELPLVSNNYIKSNIDFYHNKLTIGLGTQYRFARSHEDGAETNDVVLMNTQINYKLVDSDKLGLTIFANVRNALNQKYYAVHKVNSGTYFADAPQDPIRMRLGVNVTLK